MTDHCLSVSFIFLSHALTMHADPWIEELYCSLFLSFGASKLQHRPDQLSLIWVQEHSESFSVKSPVF